MVRRAKGDAAIIMLALVIGGIAFLVSLIATAITTTIDFIASHPIFFGIVAGILAALPGFYLAYVHWYFNSSRFKKLKSNISGHIANCNELNHHIAELKASYVDIKSYNYGSGTMSDGSNFEFKRTEWSKDTKSSFVYHCSSSICRNASNQPIKYLCKYFEIETSEASLERFEKVLNDFSAAEEGKVLLKNEKDTILDKALSEIPWLINWKNRERVIRELGFEEIDFSDLYFPTYTFQYISAGGNSSFKYDIRLNVANLDTLVTYLRELIQVSKSIEGQRALMTSKLREEIKSRDRYRCLMCGLSQEQEKNLLLEIDHIIPLSKGGITSKENLQTLCWRCNRSKGAKILST